MYRNLHLFLQSLSATKWNSLKISWYFAKIQIFVLIFAKIVCYKMKFSQDFMIFCIKYRYLHFFLQILSAKNEWNKKNFKICKKLFFRNLKRQFCAVPGGRRRWRRRQERRAAHGVLAPRSPAAPRTSRRRTPCRSAQLWKNPPKN